MRRPTAARRATGLAAPIAGALLCGALALGGAGVAHAEGLTPAQAEAARAWRGRYCTPTGCGPVEAATAGSVLGFGVAALGAVWVSRRREPRSR